jgi:hypothetical protein
MSDEIYVLVDNDGDAICAFEDKEKATKDAEECGCYVQAVRIVRNVSTVKDAND